MTWLRKVWGGQPESDEKIFLNHRHLKFQQLLRNYGRFLDLIADAAEKQGGGFVLDRRYIFSLAEELFNLAKAIVFDSMIITGKRDAVFFDVMEKLEVEGRQILDSRPNKKDENEKDTNEDRLKRVANTEALARSLAQYPVLYRDSGQVASWGVAAGPVFNLKTDMDTEKFPDGGIWVSQDLKQAVELSRVIGRVKAIIADTGDTAGYVCRMARSDRIPTVVGLRDATERLKTGDVITVDGDENTIYQGLIPELLEHYREHKGSEPEEEFEYQVLRNFRRSAFPLNISQVRDCLPGSGDLQTLHDLIHLAHELAGESLADMIADARNTRKVSADDQASRPCNLFVFDLEQEMELAGESQPNPNPDSVSSFPLAAFLNGLQDFENKSGHASRNKGDTRIIALMKNKEAALVMPCSKGFDMVDTVMTGNESSNYIYCRFDSRFGDLDQRYVRQDAALDILIRLNFAAAETNRAVTTWIARLTQSEVEKKMKILGRLWGFLKNGDKVGWRREKLSSQVEDFMQNHVS